MNIVTSIFGGRTASPKQNQMRYDNFPKPSQNKPHKETSQATVEKQSKTISHFVETL